MKISLDAYEAGNLLALLVVASQVGLDTGDWLHQVINKISPSGMFDDKFHRANISIENQIELLQRRFK